ncbi:hypothetical protein TW86_20775 [Halomonas sp. S2151]|uniref:hypothetical protein n=1 Tax=Halomonas sp. S2151 TaxID=579478 RepID=UPI0005FA3CE9|nr:hypothetical protein [Halomonas sp. S2151]KJZ05576.1 hypothetical protein TW86_20775 [Halomonas sp. S2151]
MADVTRLPCATYRTDIPASLRALAEQLERGETPMPESLVMISSAEDETVEVFTQGIRADDDVFTIGLLEMGKGLVISNHTGNSEPVE